MAALALRRKAITTHTSTSGGLTAVSREQYTALLKSLAPDMPRAFFPYQWLKLNTSQLLPKPAEAEVIADARGLRSPDQAELLFTKLGEPLSRPNQTVASLYSRRPRVDRGRLAEFVGNLKEGGYFRRTTNLHIGDLNGDLSEQVMSALRSEGMTVRPIYRDMEVMNYDRKRTIKQISSPPPGFKLDRLRDDEAQLVLDCWSSSYLQDVQLWRDRIRMLPQLCFRSVKDGSVACFLMTSPAGFATHAFTTVPFRGAHIINKLAPIALEYIDSNTGFYHAALVHKDNIASKKSMKSAKIWEDTGYKVDIMVVTPPSDQKDEKSEDQQQEDDGVRIRKPLATERKLGELAQLYHHFKEQIGAQRIRSSNLAMS